MSEVELDETGEGTLEIGDDTTLVFKVLEGTGKVLCWAVVGRLADDERAADRARACLEMQEMKERSRGLTLGLDPADRRLIAFDIRPTRDFASADDVAAWADVFGAFLKHVRALLDWEYPSYDDSDLDGEVQ